MDEGRLRDSIITLAAVVVFISFVLVCIAFSSATLCVLPFVVPAILTVVILGPLATPGVRGIRHRDMQPTPWIQWWGFRHLKLYMGVVWVRTYLVLKAFYRGLRDSINEYNLQLEGEDHGGDRFGRDRDRLLRDPSRARYQAQRAARRYAYTRATQRNNLPPFDYNKYLAPIEEYPEYLLESEDLG
ncbi:hypothetical protein F4859DRAFT_508182 [Xylaria cf. heliscus]|nr:hypothetical protein F4859DRAFT_508182 [Xylaria cf. heliscus]